MALFSRESDVGDGSFLGKSAHGRERVGANVDARGCQNHDPNARGSKCRTPRRLLHGTSSSETRCGD